jgi:Activator of Hsp90 ATPase homolog 1-like protein
MTDADVAAFAVPPIEKSVLVPCNPARAFQAFTDEMTRWWPLQTHSVGQAKARSVLIEPIVGGRVYETTDDGGTSDWGRVLTWSPPTGFSMTWHPGRPPDAHTVLELSFAAEGAATRVRLVHRGWENLGKDAQAMRDSYDGGWDKVLGQGFGDYLKRSA